MLAAQHNFVLVNERGPGMVNVVNGLDIWGKLPLLGQIQKLKKGNLRIFLANSMK